MKPKTAILIFLAVFVVVYSIVITAVVAYIFGKMKAMEQRLQNEKDLSDRAFNNMLLQQQKNMIDINDNNQKALEEKLSQQKEVTTYCNPNDRITSSFVTDFFQKSMDHAEKVLYTSTVLNQYRNGNWMDLTKVDDNTKKSIVVAMKYSIIEPVSARGVENDLRKVADTECVPLWFVILHEAIKKVIISEPYISQLSNEELSKEMASRNSGIHLYPQQQKTCSSLMKVA